VTVAELRKQAADEGINETGFYMEWLERKLLPFINEQELFYSLLEELDPEFVRAKK